MKLKKRWPLYLTLTTVAFAIVAVLSDWTVVGKCFTSRDLNNCFFLGKSIWDWLKLLGVPISLAILGYWFQQLQKRRDDSQDRDQRHQEEERAKEEILQGYFDRLSGLLIDKNIIAISAAVENTIPAEDTPQEIDGAANIQIKLLDAVRDVIRARTLSILRRFEKDGRRKGSIIQFLSESEVINKLKLNLSGANLDGADLSQFDLHDAHLSGVSLRGANLGRANLHGADLSKVNLHGADLSGANLFSSNLHYADLGNTDLRSTNLGNVNLCDADLGGASLHGADLCNSNLGGAKLSGAKLYGTKLCGADLRGAKLCEAKLRRADLHGTNLGGADFCMANVRDANFSEADLSGADLSTAEELTKDQLQNAFLCKTILPFHDLKPDRDCLKLPIPNESDYCWAESIPNLAMPDDNPLGIETSLPFTASFCKVKDIEILIDITHFYISDLKVTVISPNGTKVNLHNRTGGSTSNITPIKHMFGKNQWIFEVRFTNLLILQIPNF